MSTLPTREEAELADEFDSALWSDEWEMAADLVKARADGTLQTEQEFRDSLDYEAIARKVYVRTSVANRSDFVERAPWGLLDPVTKTGLIADAQFGIIDAALGDSE